jgi:hypothetical protein
VEYAATIPPYETERLADRRSGTPRTTSNDPHM